MKLSILSLLLIFSFMANASPAKRLVIYKIDKSTGTAERKFQFAVGNPGDLVTVGIGDTGCTLSIDSSNAFLIEMNLDQYTSAVGGEDFNSSVGIFQVIRNSRFTFRCGIE